MTSPTETDVVERLNRLAKDYGSDWPYRLPLREALSEAASLITSLREQVREATDESYHNCVLDSLRTRLHHAEAERDALRKEVEALRPLAGLGAAHMPHLLSNERSSERDLDASSSELGGAGSGMGQSE